MATHGGGNATTAPKTNPDAENDYLAMAMAWSWLALVGVTVGYAFVLQTNRYMRTIACLNNETQRYFIMPNYFHGTLKKYLLDAPLFRKRHHREFRLSSAINMGTLPGRLQTLFLIAYLVMAITLTTYKIDWTAPIREILNMLVLRTGTLAIWNMLPLFLLAGRNNPLLRLTGISFDTYNLVHRWLGRIVAAEVIVHGSSWIAGEVMEQGWASLAASEKTSTQVLSGTIAGSAMAAILLLSPSAIRHAFYETFLTFHILLVTLVIGALWCVSSQYKPRTIPSSSNQNATQVALWLGIFGKASSGVCALISSFHSFIFLPDCYGLLASSRSLSLTCTSNFRYHFHQYPGMKLILYGVIILWVFDRFLRLAKLVYRNVGNGGTRAECEILPGDAVRVTMKLARPWRFQPGQHAYIYMPKVGFHTNHPFTVAWSEEEQDMSMEKGLPMSSSDILEMRKSTMSFIIRRRTGFTDSLWKKVEKAPNGRLTTTAFLEGPYGSQELHSYGTVLLFAAGVGITHQVPHVRDLVMGYSNRTVAARKVVLIWIIQNPEHLEWIRPWMTTILALPKRRDVLKILLFVTRPRSTKEIQSPSASVQMFPGKPNIQTLIDQEVGNAVGAIGVSVCGVGALADEVRRGCRMWMDRVNIDFHEESFSW